MKTDENNNDSIINKKKHRKLPKPQVDPVDRLEHLRGIKPQDLAAFAEEEELSREDDDALKEIFTD